MKKRNPLRIGIAILLGVTVLYSSQGLFANQKESSKITPVIVIHGGTSSMNLTEKEFEKRRVVMEESLLAGQRILAKNGNAEDAVIAAIKIMEDSPEFNAGKGAVFNAAGENELDASLMLGKGRRAGAVTGVMSIKNPIEAAKVVMDKTKHTLIGGVGADNLAKQNRLTMVTQEYFYTDFRYKSLVEARKKSKSKPLLDSEQAYNEHKEAKPYLGTVGAIALDSQGCLAAGTSTGGMTNKMAGRIGDSPIIGAGNYADDNVAVSCTGTGDIFIRVVAAHEVAALYEYKGLNITKAAEETIAQVKELGGTGGIIAIDKFGTPGYAWTRNDLGMFHGEAKVGSKPIVFFPVKQ